MNYFCHETACIDDGARIGDGTKLWHFSHIMGGAELGPNCNLGQNCFVADGVKLGANVKVQNNVSIYTGTVIEDDVFLGPSCVLTNVSNPRSQIVRQGLYERTLIRRGASIGANATVVCGTTIGRYAFVAAGAVVTRDVPDYALIVGVPGRQKGWISRHGIPLSDFDDKGQAICSESGLRYELCAGALRCLDQDEDDPLREDLRQGGISYRDVRPRGGDGPQS
jgi:UDP-2-acetamido-3-amino-2,3-dideoxy-glucuronate N-acetyltransferase